MTSIVSMDQERTIAIADEGIPWDLPDDGGIYMDIISSEHLVVGRRTYGKIRDYITKPSILLTRDPNYDTGQDHVYTAQSKEQAEYMLDQINGRVYNVGGSAIYDLFFDETDELIVSHVPKTYKGDLLYDEKKFPKIKLDDWRIKRIELHNGFRLIKYGRNL